MSSEPREFFEKHLLGPSPSSADVQRLTELLWQAYSQQIFLLAYATLGNLEDARDICQDTFVNAIKWLNDNPGQRPATTNFPAWLRRIAQNLIIDRFRRPAYEVQFSALTSESQDQQSPADWSRMQAPDPPDPLDKEDELNALRQCIQSLPEPKRRVLLLRDIEGKPYETIAHMLGTSVRAIGVILHRVRKELRDCVQSRLAL